MTVVSGVEESQKRAPTTHYDVVVVGAGPYGLNAAAQLLGKGLNVAVFGKTMELWRNHMPVGMYLRSHWWATSLSDSQKKYSFENFFKEKNCEKVYPVPVELFIEYALWFQKNAVPNVDETYVSSIERQNKRYVLTLEDGRVVQATAVVMAVGVYHFAYRPAEYDAFPAEYVSHSFEHKNFDSFKGKNLLIIGGGQSATENAALAHEAGATVHLVSRSPINWLSADTLEDERPLLTKIKAPNAGIACGWYSWIIEHVPFLFYRFPQDKKDTFLRNYYGPAAADWLKDRIIGKVHVHEGRKVKKMEAQDSGVEATLDNGEKLHADHVMLATGYSVDLKRLPMVHPSLLAQIRSDNDTPVLNSWFESNVPGLYFTGLSSIRTFGPLFRFVLGASASGQRVASAVARYVRK